MAGIGIVGPYCGGGMRKAIEIRHADIESVRPKACKAYLGARARHEVKPVSLN